MDRAEFDLDGFVEGIAPALKEKGVTLLLSESVYIDLCRQASVSAFDLDEVRICQFNLFNNWAKKRAFIRKNRILRRHRNAE